MTTTDATTRKAFRDRENRTLARFLDTSDLIGWQRTYKCECGFSCFAPNDIYDHSAECPTTTTTPGEGR